MHDVQGFHEALSGLTPRGRIALDYRCQGHSLSVVAEDQGVNMEAIRSRMTVVFRRLRRRTRSLVGVREQGITEAACYHLGYEPALADIEAQLTQRGVSPRRIDRGGLRGPTVRNQAPARVAIPAGVPHDRRHEPGA